MLSIALAASTPRGGKKKKTDGWLICFCKWGRRNHSGARRRSRVMRVWNLHRSCGARARRPRQLGQRQGGQIWGGEKPEDRWSDGPVFKHIITDYIFREETVKKAKHVTLFFWCKGSKTHFAVGPQDSLSFPRRRASTLLFLVLLFVFKPWYNNKSNYIFFICAIEHINDHGVACLCEALQQLSRLKGN